MFTKQATEDMASFAMMTGAGPPRYMQPVFASPPSATPAVIMNPNKKRARGRHSGLMSVNGRARMVMVLAVWLDGELSSGRMYISAMLQSMKIKTRKARKLKSRHERMLDVIGVAISKPA